MKRFLLSVCLCLGLCADGRAQVASGDAISYQAIARDASGQIIAERPIGVKVEILQGSAEGAAVYSETHEAETSPTGVVNLSIGNGTEPAGAFSDIDWGASTYFLRLSMDTKGGKDYKEVATTQIMPVPYALYAKEAGKMKSNNEATKFLITSSENETIYNMMANKEVSFSVYQTEEYGFFSFFCSILYLDGNDQELNIEIEGLPAGSSFTDDKDYSGASVSTTQGRYFEMAYRIPVNAGTTHNVKLVVKDKNNQTIKEYPFTLTLEKKS